MASSRSRRQRALSQPGFRLHHQQRRADPHQCACGATGRVEHARLGVTVQDLSQPLAESFGLARPDGALIANVAAGSAAATAGLIAGDVITAVNGEPIVRSGDLSSRISLAAPGETVRLKVWRDGSAREMSVKLGRAEERASSPTQPDSAVHPGQLGLKLRPLTREEQTLARVQGGLLIEGVAGRRHEPA